MKTPLNATEKLKKLEERRARVGMSKTDVARRSGVSLPTVNRILSGKEPEPSIVTIHAISCLWNWPAVRLMVAALVLLDTGGVPWLAAQELRCRYYKAEHGDQGETHL